MATPPFNIAETLPQDDDFASAFPSVERTFRDVVESWLLVEHGVSGHHTFGIGNDAARNAITDWEEGSLWLSTQTANPRLQALVSAAWVSFANAAELASLVAGPASVTDARVALFDGTTGKLLKEASEGILTTVAQAEAEAGVATDRRVWTAQRVKQAIVALSLSPAPDVIIEDIKSSGVNGGSFSSGSWLTRDLNTLTRNVGSIASLGSNQFTLPSGTYYIEWMAPGMRCGSHISRIFNVSDAAQALLGGTATTSSATNVVALAEGQGVVTIAASKTFRIEHRGETTANTDGFGRALGAGVNERYSFVKLWKVA